MLDYICKYDLKRLYNITKISVFYLKIRVIMKKLFLLIFIYFSFVLAANSQDAVISEVFYSGGASNEWTEILVVKDNISLVGYSIRDNSGDRGWQGGVRFKDLDLWKNLREGTVIIINHRGSVIDDNKADGYIEIGAESTYYFDQFNAPGTGGDWAVGGSLDLNSSYDMIQLRNQLDQHVHCLGYIGGQIGDNYDTIPKPNIFFNQSISQNESVKVAPGLNINNYLAGLSPANIEGSSTPGSVTKGLPNKRNSTDYQNQSFWRELRQPDWTNPGIINTRIVNNFSSVELSWNAASTFSDPNEGYMIVRFVENNNIELIIEDGKIYNVGKQFGPYKVIGYVETLTKTEFLDEFKDGEEFECGKKYAYRIYAYRYQASDIEDHRLQYDVADVRNARGRQYNETSFASSPAIIKEIPPTPFISTTIGQTQFCSNVDVKLESNLKDVQKYHYLWYSVDDGQITDNGHSITLDKAGTYWLVLEDKSSGCTSKSNEIKIEILEAPNAFIRNPNDNKTFNKDTTIQICQGSKIDLQGLSIPSGQNITFRWTKDGVDFTASNNISVTTSGVYEFIAEAGGLCPDTSITLTAVVINPDFSVSESLLSFDADNSPEQNFIVTNNADTDLILNKSDVVITPLNNYQIISPSVFPVVIPAKGNVTFKLKFSLVGFGTNVKGKITISTACNLSKSIDLVGERIDVGVTRLDPNVRDLDLGIKASLCIDDDQSSDSISFISSGKDDLFVTKPRFLTANFTYICDAFDASNVITVKPGGTFGGYVKVATNIPGDYTDTLVVAYLAAGKTDSSYTKVSIKLKIYDPSIQVITKLLDVSGEVTCKKTLDTFIVVSNPSITDILINKDVSDARVSISDILPKIIKSGETDTINVRFSFTDSSPFNFNLNYENPCELISEIISIRPPAVDLDVTLSESVIDFGIINNCVTSGVVTKTSSIIASSDGAFIGEVLYNGTLISSSLFKDKKFAQGSTNFDVSVLADTEGLIRDSIVFVVEPCGQRYVVHIIGERINPKRPVFSAISIDFGTDNILVAGNQTFTIINENPNLELVLDSINVPLPFELISHNKADFPIVIPASGVLDLRLEYKRLSVGKPALLMQAYFSKPCKENFEFIIRGTTIDSRLVSLKALLPDSEIIQLGTEKRMPINLEFDPNYSIADIGLRNMAFYISYDYVNLNLRTALTGPAINSPTSMINFDDSQSGRLILTLNIANPDRVTNGDLIYVTVKPLLGDALQAKIILDSVVVSSSMTTKVETNESDITIIGDCDLEGRLLAVTGAVNITVRGSDPNSSIRIDYSTVSDEKTNITVYNNSGELVDVVRDGFYKHGEYSLLYDTSKLSSGVYNFVLTNGTRIETFSYPLVK